MDRRPVRPRATARVLEQYLHRYAEPEAREASSVSRAFPRVAVVPALGEGESLDRALASIRAAGGGEALIIVVLNARASDPAGVHAANAAARARLSGDDLLLVDRAGPGRWIPEKEGVGLARKIGTDLAVALRAAGRVNGRWIHHTDADAEVPPDWFERAEAAPDDAVAVTFPFRHEPVAEGAAAEHVVLYELWLRYHRLGLAAAGSPYAFQAIGSTMATDADAMVLARGWPRTMAGEDFYLLDKLAKLGVVRMVTGTPIRLAGRASDRVPFGTGRALLDMAERRESAATWTMMDAAAYAALGRALAALDAAADPARPSLTDSGSAGAPEDLDVLARMGAVDFVKNARALNLPAHVRRRRLHTWFDAFRTLRFLHTLRDNGLSPRPWRDALEGAAFLERGAPHPADRGSPTTWLARLQALDEATCPAAGVLLPSPGEANSSAMAD